MSGYLELTVLLLPGLLSLLWVRSWLRPSTLGGRGSRLGELPKSLPQFRQGWTSLNSLEDQVQSKLKASEYLFVREPYYTPPKILQGKGAYYILPDLFRFLMGSSVNLKYDPVLRQTKISYTTEMGEWVFDPVGDTELAYLRFDYRLRGGTFKPKVVPVTKEAHIPLRPIPLLDLYKSHQGRAELSRKCAGLDAPSYESLRSRPLPDILHQVGIPLETGHREIQARWLKRKAAP